VHEKAAVDLQENSLQKDKLTQNISDIWRWARIWSFVHHTFLFGTAILSTLAAVVLQLKATGHETLLKDIARILSACAALSTVIAASGAFERKWRNCRSTHSRLMEFEIDLTPQNAASQELKERYKAIWRDHEHGITGSGKWPRIQP
jgi:hypothetical protein